MKSNGISDENFDRCSEITSREFLAALPAKRLTPQKLRCLNDLARGLLMQIPGLNNSIH